MVVLGRGVVSYERGTPVQYCSTKGLLIVRVRVVQDTSVYSAVCVLLLKRPPPPRLTNLPGQWLQRQANGCLFSFFIGDANVECSPPSYTGVPRSLKTTPPPLGPPQEPSDGPTEGSYGVAISYKRGTPVVPRNKVPQNMAPRNSRRR